MWYAELNDFVTPDNAGGRKNFRPVEVGLNQRSANDILKQKRKAAAIVSNDAKGCFDRIVHSVAYICLRRFGLPRAPVQSMLTAIQELTHFVRTAYGDSTATHGSKPGEAPYQGLLQGNGAAGTDWLAIVPVMV